MAIESFQRKDNLTLAICSILLAIFSLSFGDAMIKLLSAEFQLSRLYVIRSSLAIPVLVMLVKWGKKGSPLVPLSVRWVALRSLLLASMWIAYYAALPHIQLSVAAAIYYTIPLFITLYSALFSGDRVSRNAWIAIFIGFIGVLIIAQPSSSAFNGYVPLPLLAAIAYQRGPSSTVATFDYSYLAFSAFWGWLVFTEIPDLPAIIAMLMIATAGIIALRN